MPVIDHLDIPAKRIYLATGTTSYHPVDDLYKEVRALRRTDDTLRVVTPPLAASGNVSKGGGKFTPRLVTFRNGWRVVPEDVSHTLNVTGEQITDDGQSGPACFDLAPISPTSKIIIQYEPPAAEIIVVSGGEGATDWTTTEKNQIRGALGIAGTQSAPAGGGHLQDIRTPVQSNLDAAITSRSSHTAAQVQDLILTDATPFQGARIDAAISSRTVPGDAMALTSGERLALAFAVLEEPLANHTTSIGSLGHEIGHVHDALILRHGTVQAGSTTQVIITNITGTDNIYLDTSLIVRGATERCIRVVKNFNASTGTFTVSIPFAFTPQPGDSVFVLGQWHSAALGAVR